MRLRAWLVLTIVGAALFLPGTAAHACAAYCGLFFELDHTYYVPGDDASGSGTVWVPEKKQDEILAKGPFIAWLLPQGSSLRAGRPIPAGAVEVGAFDVGTSKDSIVLSFGFPMPQLPSGWYTLEVCNDPCTQVGLGQGITGSFYAAATPQERKLLIERDQMESRIWGLQRDARKADKTLAETRAELKDTTTALSDAREEAAGLRDDLAAARREPAPGRPLVDGWVVLASTAVIGLALVVRRRRRRPAAAAARLPEAPGAQASERELVSV